MRGTRHEIDETGEIDCVDAVIDGIDICVSFKYHVSGYEINYSHNCCVDDDCPDEGESEVDDVFNVVFYGDDGEKIKNPLNDKQNKELDKLLKDYAEQDYCD